MIHNYRPQAAARLGLEYEAVRAVNPRWSTAAPTDSVRRGPYGTSRPTTT